MDSDAEATSLKAAYEQGLNGRKPQWLHNLGACFEQRMQAAYRQGKAEKVQLALAQIRASRKPREQEQTYDPMIEVRAMAAAVCIDAAGRLRRPSKEEIRDYVLGPQRPRLAGMRDDDAVRLVEEAIDAHLRGAP